MMPLGFSFETVRHSMAQLTGKEMPDLEMEDLNQSELFTGFKFGDAFDLVFEIPGLLASFRHFLGPLKTCSFTRMSRSLRRIFGSRAPIRCSRRSTSSRSILSLDPRWKSMLRPGSS